MSNRAFICGFEGLSLSDVERAFIFRYRPWGAILFARNVSSETQVFDLCSEIRECLDDPDAPVFIDQEGGRVQRIKPPIVRAYPASEVYGRIYRKDMVSGVEAARLAAKLIGLDLRTLGISGNCSPVLDIPVAGSDPVIGNRALGEDVDTVATLGTAMIDGFASVGILPVMKHLPGHGRANVDSHESLPVVDCEMEALESVDLLPFRYNADRVPLAMTAHVVFSAVDEQKPATLSEQVIDKVIRKRIGYSGVLMTDDISMGALSGTVAERASGALAAGCDLVLHCNGILDEMVDVAEACPEITGVSLARVQADRDWCRQQDLEEPLLEKHEIYSERLDRLLLEFGEADA